MQSLLRSLMVALIAVSSMGQASAQESRGAEVYRKCLPSVAYVEVPEKDGARVGTAIVVDAANRLLLTCHHVVRGDKEVTLLFPERDASGKVVAERNEVERRAVPIKARVLAIDPKRDVALLQTESLPGSVRPVTHAAGEPEPGEVLHQIGCPASIDALWIYSTGEVRQVFVQQWTSGGQGWKAELKSKVVASSMVSNGGDSGAPVFNGRGELVGMHQGRNTAANGMATAIAVSELRSFVTANAPKPVVLPKLVAPTTTPLLDSLVVPASAAWNPLRPNLPPLYEPLVPSGVVPGPLDWNPQRPRLNFDPLVPPAPVPSNGRNPFLIEKK